MKIEIHGNRKWIRTDPEPAEIRFSHTQEWGDHKQALPKPPKP
jgi:hypothetical protein